MRSQCPRWHLIIDGRGTMPPDGVIVLPFDGTPLWVIVCFLRAIGAKEEAIFRKVLDQMERRS